MLGLTFPEWFTPDNLRTIAIAVLVGALVLIFLVLRFVQKVMMKASFTVLLALVAFGAWHYRTELGDCARTCNCRVLGIDIKIPADQMPVVRCPTGTA